MAHKAQSFILNEKKKTITIYTNVEASPAEVELKNYYLSNGYAPLMGEKKPGITIAQMRKALAKDPDTLAAFEEAYKKKNGFFPACKIYTNWKKEHKEE